MILHKLRAIKHRVAILASGSASCVSSRLVLFYRRYWLPSMASGKLDTPEFKALLSPDIIRLNKLFTSNGYSIRLVGGVVRDLLLGQKPKDIDLATECLPEEVLRLLEEEKIRNIPTGLQHGTVTAHMDTDYEITTLRIDRVTDGRHAVVEFTNDWKLDAERRDLTINAMSLSLDGTLYDYFEGQRHLAERRVQFVGDSRKRIKEDYLRILRYFRFFGRISLSPDSHDQDTLEAIKETAGGLRGISVERIWLEMKRIVIGNYAPSLLSLMYDLGVAENIGLPSNPNLDEFHSVWTRLTSQKNFRQHTLEPVTLLVTLVRSPKEAENLSRKWKLSNLERQLAVFVATHRTATGDKETLIKYFKDLLVDNSQRHHVTEVLKYSGKWDDADEINQWKIPVLPVVGNDLKEVGLSPGPQMGRTLKMIKESWKKSYYTLNKDELLEMVLKKQIIMST